MDPVVRRALVSTYDKSGVVDFCRRLHSRGIEIVSTGGTSRLLQDEGIPVVSVSSVTGFPEMLDGRVKTLHPRIHGGILAVRENAVHMGHLHDHGIAPIDLVVVNLYPFEKAVADGLPDDDIVEMMDVGGPAMVRAAAKNMADVAVVVDPADYASVAGEIEANGSVSTATRRTLAGKAFARTAAYDGAIAAWLTSGRTEGFPATLHMEFAKRLDLVYGENPHQTAAFYVDPGPAAPGLASARQLQGKPLSFNNILDLDASLGTVRDLGRLGRRASCVIVKHGNPCGAACAGSTADAFRSALACDPTSAFGGVIAFDGDVDGSAAEAIAEAFYEAVLAPAFHEDALRVLARKKNLRVLSTGPLPPGPRPGRDLRRVDGGLLVQDWDSMGEAVRGGRVVSRRSPTDDEWLALEFAWTVCRHVKSNAIVFAGPDRTLGVGAGQMSRLDSARIAVQKAQSPLVGAVMASDAFFPFRDGLDVGADAGITAVVQPGGSVRDEEVVEAARKAGITMYLTGTRHFFH